MQLVDEISHAVWLLMRRGDLLNDPEHILDNRVTNRPKVSQIEAVLLRCVAPDQEKLATRLDRKKKTMEKATGVSGSSCPSF